MTAAQRMQQATISQDAACSSAVRDRHALPHGVELRPLAAHRDERGSVAEFFRAEWAQGCAPVQWAMTASEAGVVRGMHVHLRHDDYFVVVSGTVSAGLRDLRPSSPSEGLAVLLELSGDAPAALVIPHGVAHGFMFHTPSIFILGTSHYYDRADELGCHWRDPQLGLAWPEAGARLSPRDAALPALRELLPHIPAWRGG